MTKRVKIALAIVLAILLLLVIALVTFFLLTQDKPMDLPEGVAFSTRKNHGEEVFLLEKIVKNGT